MSKDRQEVCKIISKMLDNPDECGIYPTSTAYGELENYIQRVRVEAIGWAYSYACTTLDNGGDPRLKEVPEMLNQAMKDLSIEPITG